MWNAKNPLQKVRVGDKVVEVDGVRDRSYMSDELKKHEMHTIIIKRAGWKFDLDHACERNNREEVGAHFLEDYTFIPANPRPGHGTKSWEMVIGEAFREVKTPALMTVGEWRTNRIFFNFVVHARNASNRDESNLTIVNLALDERGHEFCNELRETDLKDGPLELVCVDLTGWLPSDLFSESKEMARGRGNAGAGTCIYNIIIWSKPHMLLTAVKASPFGVLMIDTDVIIYHDPFPTISQITAASRNAAVITGKERDGNLNTGTVYASKAGIPILEEWANFDGKFLSAGSGDQAALQYINQQNHTVRSHIVQFPNDVVGQCAIRGTVATHYNCYGNKRMPMNREGDWDARADSEARKMAGHRSGNLIHVQQGADDQNDYIKPEHRINHTIAAIQNGGDWWIE